MGANNGLRRLPGDGRNGRYCRVPHTESPRKMPHLRLSAQISGSHYWPSIFRGPSCPIERPKNSAAFTIAARGVSRAPFRLPPMLRPRLCFICGLCVERITLHRGFFEAFHFPSPSLRLLCVALRVLFFDFFAVARVLISVIGALY